MRWFVLLLLVAPAALLAADAPKLPQYDFEDGVDGWISMAPGGQVLAATDAKRVRAGKSALEYRYEAKAGEMPVLALPTPGGLAGAKSLRFDVSTDGATIVLVALVEEGGARYEYQTVTPAEGWVHVEVDVSELRRADDSTDANNRLDLGEVRNVLFSDVLAVLATIDNDFSRMLGTRKGPHSLWLDDVVVSDKSVLEAPPAGQVIIDDFRRESIPWIPLAGVTLTVGAAPEGAQGRALRMEHAGEAGKITAIMRPFPAGTLAGATKLTFSAAARAETTLAVVLEEAGGARYMATTPLAAGAPKPITLAAADFRLADDSKDDNARLDMDQVKSLGFLDVGAMMGAVAGGNVLWFQQLKAEVTPPK